MKNSVLTGLWILSLIAVGAYCFWIGNITQTVTYESDLALCETACESNDGTDRMWTDFYCICGNGATFTDDDLRP